MDGEKVIRGPGSYERYDEIAISCQKKYFRLFKLQILVLSLIAFLSLLPPFSETGTDIIKYSIELTLIIVVLSIMIIMLITQKAGRMLVTLQRVY
ncbi:MAG: hypothetical protein C5S49_02320 [Candidatus Methanogaster sp.]|nr:MAG: hypothetical protein C5S49_02320 [ANME-2 cluster archaeon]